MSKVLIIHSAQEWWRNATSDPKAVEISRISLEHCSPEEGGRIMDYEKLFYA